MRSSTLRGETSVRRPSFLTALVAAGLLSLAAGAGRADTSSPLYRSATVVTSGDKSRNVQIPAGYELFAGGLSDAGEIVFSAGNDQGTKPELLLKWSDGFLIPIAAPSTGPASASPGPIYWTHDLTIDRPVSVNQRGYVLFSADHTGGGRSWGTFLWNASNQQIAPVALKGMPATGNLLFTAPGGSAPALNNANEMALVAQVKDTAGTVGYGLFFLGQDGVLRPVLLPGEALPGGSGQNQAQPNTFLMPSINDAGVIAFLSPTRASSRYSAYMWEYGTIIPVMTTGTTIPGQGKVTGVSSAFVNNKNRTVLVTATTDRWGSRLGVYKVLNGQITTVVAPGGYLPGGGTLRTVQYFQSQENRLPLVGVSSANAAGQHVFLATLQDGSTAVYRSDPGGSLSLVSKISSGTPPPVQIADATPSPTIVPGSRPCLNNHGQIAISVRTLGGPSMIVLLTPTKP
jgi:hypothetical protein